MVPPVPIPATKWVTVPSVCAQISGPVVSWCEAGFSGFAYWSGCQPPGISAAIRRATL